MRETTKASKARELSQIKLKTPREIGLMREAGRLVARILSALTEAAKPGVSTGELAAIADGIFQEANATPLFLGYPHHDDKGPAFPSALCASVNEQVVHGIPSRKRILQEGDVVSLDIGARLNGWCGDSAISLPIGKVSPEHRKLLDVGKGTLDLAIELLPKRHKWSEVAREMEAFVKKNGMSAIEKFVGHGIGRDMHESPQVPNFMTDDMLKHDFGIEPGLVLAIEPMVSLGRKEVRTLDDKWTVITKDRKYSVHFEHTVAMTPTGPEIMTLL